PREAHRRARARRVQGQPRADVQQGRESGARDLGALKTVRDATRAARLRSGDRGRRDYARLSARRRFAPVPNLNFTGAWRGALSLALLRRGARRIIAVTCASGGGASPPLNPSSLR